MPGRPMTMAVGPTSFAADGQEANTDAHNYSNRDYYGGGMYENNPLQGPTNVSVGDWGGNYSNSPIPGPFNPPVGDWGGTYDNGVASRSSGWGPPPSNPVLPQSGFGRSFAPPVTYAGAPPSVSVPPAPRSLPGSSMERVFEREAPYNSSSGPPAPPAEPGFGANRTMFADSAPYQSYPWSSSGFPGGSFPCSGPPPAGMTPAESARQTPSLPYGSAPSQGHSSRAPSGAGGLSAGLDQLSLQDLLEMRDERANAVHDLKQEIDELKEAPDLFERRLRRLEGAFGSVQPGDAVLVKAPLLRNIHRCVKEKQILEHEEAKDHHKEMYQHEEWYDPTQAYAETNSLVLGRGYMSLDPQTELKLDYQERHVKHPHPVVEEVHYAGHLTKAADQIHPMYVGPHGQSERKAGFKPQGWHGEFWLDQPEDSSAKGHRQHPDVMAVSASQQALINKVTRSSLPAKHEEDTQPRDHLGMKKREMPDADIDHEEWVLPRWMY